MGKFSKLLALVLLVAQPALAWGPYPHQQIQDIGEELIAETELGRWMRMNADTTKRLSMTPDIDWKVFGPGPANPELRRLKEIANAEEPATHFFDADMFSLFPREGRVRADELPDDTDFADAYPRLAQALSRNARRLHPEKPMRWPTPHDVAGFGTGPWRAVQMYDLSVTALAQGDHEKALIYLTALGHYIADLAVPLHTTVHFDGEGEDAHGLHLAFEMKMIESLAALRHSYKDPETELWHDFSATEGPVLSWAQADGLPELSRDSLVREIYGLIEESYQYLEPLNNAYSEVMRNRWIFHSERYTLGKFRKKVIELPDGRRMTVMDAANERMGRAARLLARVWLSVDRDARKIAPSFKPLDTRVPFDEGRVIRAYRPPEYLRKTRTALVVRRQGEPSVNDRLGSACRKTLGLLGGFFGN